MLSFICVKYFPQEWWTVQKMYSMKCSCFSPKLLMVTLHLFSGAPPLLLASLLPNFIIDSENTRHLCCLTFLLLRSWTFFKRFDIVSGGKGTHYVGQKFEQIWSDFNVILWNISERRGDLLSASTFTQPFTNSSNWVQEGFVMDPEQTADFLIWMWTKFFWKT